MIAPEDVPAPNSILGALESLMGSPHLCSRRWIWEQYDHMVMGDTIERPGGDAGVVRIHGTQKALAISCDVTPRYCAADPTEGAKQAVAECWRNLTAVGADPLAITDCLNFGNPERPEIMGEFVGAVEGMAEACRALAFPVVSGNVSLYNETNGVAIPPTPAVGGVGLIPDIAKIARIGLTQDGDALILIGAEGGHLGQSLYQELAQGKNDGAPPPVDLDAELRAGNFVRGLIRDGAVSAVHDISDGGLLVAIAEMALAGRHRRRARCAAARPSRPCGVVRRGSGPLCACGFAEACRTHLAAGGKGCRSGQDCRKGKRPRLETARRSATFPGRAEIASRGLVAGLHGRRLGSGEDAELRRFWPMAMAVSEIEKLIREGLPDAQVSIEDLAGDGDHYAATVVSEAFRGKTRVQQHQMVYDALKGQMGGALHALALKTSAPS